MSSETRLTSRSFQDVSQDSGSDQNRRFLTEYITYTANDIFQLISKATYVNDHIYIQSSVSNAATRHPDHQPSDMASSISFPVSPFRRFVNQLIKRWIHVVCELNLCNWLHALCSTSNCEAHNPLFAQRCIEYSFCAEFRSEINTATEHTPKGNIFAKDQRAFIRA